MRLIAVFAGHSEVDTPEAFGTAHQIGRLLGDNGLTMLYDGATVGPIATIAEASLAAGGRVVGFQLEGAPAPDRLTERRVVATERHRQTEIAAMADAFLALPGGLPSLEAALGVWDWAPAAHGSPLGLLDLDRFFTELMKEASDETLDRFVRQLQRGQLVVTADGPELLRRLVEYRPPETRRGEEFTDQ
jgi:uncharacterized protein (TIGR00730 family)